MKTGPQQHRLTARRALSVLVALVVVGLSFGVVLPRLAPYGAVWHNLRGLSLGWAAVLLGAVVLNVCSFRSALDGRDSRARVRPGTSRQPSIDRVHVGCARRRSGGHGRFLRQSARQRVFGVSSNSGRRVDRSVEPTVQLRLPGYRVCLPGCRWDWKRQHHDDRARRRGALRSLLPDALRNAGEREPHAPHRHSPGLVAERCVSNSRPSSDAAPGRERCCLPSRKPPAHEVAPADGGDVLQPVDLLPGSGCRIRAIGGSAAHVDVGASFAAWSAGRLLSSIPFTPGGIGYTEVALSESCSPSAPNIHRLLRRCSYIGRYRSHRPSSSERSLPFGSAGLSTPEPSQTVGQMKWSESGSGSSKRFASTPAAACRPLIIGSSRDLLAHGILSFGRNATR